ncbi:MAG: TonB-dependent receptor [Bacteroidales bacterium]|nr:TonB-dependent receptor [Bacteroidales bacterium]
MKRLIPLIALFFSAAALAQSGEPDSIAHRELGEVVVKGEKPFIRSHDGIMVVDLPAIVSDKPVTNILEALGYLPGVVSDNGMIGLNGASGVTIILNGEPTNMPVQNLYQLLYSTPVDKLKNVEIMYAAPAKYHTSGAVINIVLKTPRAIDGLMGQALAGYTQAHKASWRAGLGATYAVKDWTFDVNWTLARNKTRNRQETLSNHSVAGQTTLIEDDMQQIGENLSNLVYASATFKKIKAIYTGQFASDSKSTSLSSGTFGDYTNRYTFRHAPAYHNVALRYVAPFNLTVGGDYTYYSEDREQNLSRQATPLARAFSRQIINRWHAYADQEHQLGNWQMNYGLEYQHSADDSRQIYVVPEIAGFDGTLREDVAKVYVGTQASLSWGLSLSASVAAEYFHNDFQHNWNFVPQLSATYYKTPKSIFQLNFTTQRVYPQYWELHGGTAHINDYSIVLSNPALQPYMNYSGQLSYILNQKYAATFYVLYSDDYSAQLPYQQPDALRLLFQTVNYDFSRTVGLQIQVPFTLGYALSSNAVANVMNKREKADRFHDISFDNHRWGFYASLDNTIRFSREFPVSLSVGASLISGQIQGPGRFNAFWKLDAGAKWQFGRGRSCELALKCNDIFNTWSPKLTIRTVRQDYQMTACDMVRNLNLTFVWRFNGFKAHDSEVDTSRFGTGQ